MPGAVTLRARVIKDGVKLMALKNPIFIPGPVEPHFSKYLTFEGISVDEQGKQHCLDATVVRSCRIIKHTFTADLEDPFHLGLQTSMPQLH